MKVKINSIPHFSWYILPEATGQPASLQVSVENHNAQFLPFPSDNLSLPSPPLYQHTSIQKTTKSRNQIRLKLAFLLHYGHHKGQLHTWWLYPFPWMHKFIPD